MLRRPTRSPWHAARPVGLRRARVDAFRVFAMALVVLGHSELLLGPSRHQGILLVEYLLNVVSRGAVPLFLILAGEHLGPRLARDKVPGAAAPYVRRLAALYAFGWLFYWVTDFAKLARARGPVEGTLAFIARQDPLALLLHGPRPHLWFLIVLMLVVTAAAVILARVRVRVRHVVVGAAVLYGVGLAVGPYRAQLQTTDIGWWYELLLQSPLFFAIGVVFGLEPERRSRWTTGLALVGLGLVLHTVEVQWITHTYGTWPFRLAMLMGTVAYATGVAMLALSPGATSFERWAGRLAPYVPAVYITHIFFVETLRPPRGQFPELLVRILLPVLATALAFGTAWLYYRLRGWVTRRRARAGVL